jgi:hypothetical protein
MSGTVVGEAGGGRRVSEEMGLHYQCGGYAHAPSPLEVGVDRCGYRGNGIIEGFLFNNAKGLIFINSCSPLGNAVYCN